MIAHKNCLSRFAGISGLALGFSLLLMFFLQSLAVADSFPFRSVKVGDDLPDVTLRDLTDRQKISLRELSGKPLIAVFFGADIAAKEKRSVEILKAVEELAPFLKEKGIAALAVSAQDDPADKINEVIKAGNFSSGAYLDDEKSAYGGLGLFVLPSTLLISADGKVAAGLGYSRNFSKRLKGEIEVMLGEKTREQLEQELHPKITEKSKEKKKAKRHFKTGLNLLKRGRNKSAMREFNKAIDLEPDMGDAYIQLGCLHLNEGKVGQAAEFLEKGMQFEPDSAPGRICRARVRALEGDIDGAIDELQAMLFRSSRNDKLHYVLATLFEEKGDLAEAAKEYRKAYELLTRHSGPE